MADGKVNRNSFAAKVATPKTATPGTSTPPAQAIPDSMEALGKAIGARIKLTTAAPHAQTYEGTLSTACPILNLVFVESRAPNAQASTFNVIPVARLQSFQIMSLAAEQQGGFASAQPPLAPVDVKRLEQRLDAKVEKAKEEERHQGKGVTREAQAIYDAIKRINMPIRWHNQEMIVYDAVIIPPPYRPEDCKAANGKQEVLNRVRKVLEGERKKIRDREAKAASNASGGPRLGG